MVKQNTVRVKQASTGLDFIALIPYYNMMEKKLQTGGETETEKEIERGSRSGAGSGSELNLKVADADDSRSRRGKSSGSGNGNGNHDNFIFGLDGSVSVRSVRAHTKGHSVAVSPGNYTDPEFFLRYLSVPEESNEHNFIKLSLPGSIPKGSKFHFCMKGTVKEQNRDECKGAFKSESMFWKSKVLGMNTIIAVCLSVYPSVCLSICQSFCVLASLSICLSVCVCVCVCFSVCLCVCFSVYQSVCLPIRLVSVTHPRGRCV